MSAMSATGNNTHGLLPGGVLYVERVFNPDSIQPWSDSIKSTSIWLSVVYLILVFTGQRLMRRRSAFDLRAMLFLWNAALAAFSILGAFRTVPELYTGLIRHGWTFTVCDASFYYGPTGFWAFAFTMSKPIELGDTLFIVLRRQPLIFLHWYHHITVMVYCFYSYPPHVSSARWYIAMNYCVHSVMYTYFALRAVRIPVPHFMRMSVTALQILQMAAGLSVALSVVVLKQSGVDCHQSYANVTAAVLMYFSYLVLFGQFFYQQYAAPAKNKTPSSGQSASSLRTTGSSVKKRE